MQEAEMGLTNLAMTAGTSNAQYSEDDKLLVKFQYETKEDEQASREAGRPIFKEVEYIDIQVPGTRNRVNRPVRPSDKSRFPRHYQAFQLRQEQPQMDGTPLSEWPGVTRSMAEELAFFKIHTVEQLAGMADVNTSNIKGAMFMKQKAQAYLDASKENSAALALAEQKKENDKLRAEMAELRAMMQSQGDEPKPRRKRRTKAEMEADKANTE